MHVLACVECRCELERIPLASGRAVVVCLSCEMIGDEREVAHGAKLVPLEKPMAVKH